MEVSKVCKALYPEQVIASLLFLGQLLILLFVE